MRLAFCGRLAPLPLRCLRFATRFLAESVRAARSVATVYRNPNNSVFWQGQASACGNLANAPLFALLGFARAVVPCSRRPPCGLLLVPAPLSGVVTVAPGLLFLVVLAPRLGSWLARGLRAWRAQTPAPSRLPALRGVGWSPT